MDKIKNKRKNYYIDKQFQRNFILKFCGLILVGSAISSLIIYTMARATVTTTFENSRLAIKSTADFILPSISLSSGISVILIGLATIAVTLFTSHKIAGPLYRLNKDVEEVASGNLKVAFRLRSGDEIKPLAQSLNVMTQELRGRIKLIKNTLSDLDSAVKSSGNASPEVKEKIRQLREETEKFHT